MASRNLTKSYAMVRDELRAGTPAVIRILAERTGLSKITVRAALKALGVAAVSLRDAVNAAAGTKAL